jgi:hypothetical protein
MEGVAGLDQQTQHHQEERSKSFRRFHLPLAGVAIAAALQLPHRRVLVLHRLGWTMRHSLHLDPTAAMTESSCVLAQKNHPVNPHEMHHHRRPDRDHDADQMVESVYAGPSVACFQSEEMGGSIC